MACISKTADCRAKRTEILDSGIVVTGTWGTFGLLRFKVILGSFGALVSKLAVSQIRLAVERNGVKFGTRGY